MTLALVLSFSESDFMLLLAFLAGISWHASPPASASRVCTNGSGRPTNEELFSCARASDQKPALGGTHKILCPLLLCAWYNHVHASMFGFEIQLKTSVWQSVYGALHYNSEVGLYKFTTDYVTRNAPLKSKFQVKQSEEHGQPQARHPIRLPPLISNEWKWCIAPFISHSFCFSVLTQWMSIAQLLKV